MEINEIYSKTTPLVSIVVPVYNTQRYVMSAIESVQRQTYNNWELILVDDFSCDGSGELCDQAAVLDSRITVIHQLTNEGALFARNAGISMATGKYICFLDSDDTFEPRKIEIQLAYMLLNNCAMSFTMFKRINESGEALGGCNVSYLPKVSYRQMLGAPRFSIITVMLDRERLKVPILTCKLRKAEDYIFQLRILKQGIEALGINEELSNYRFRHNSSSVSFFGNSLDLWAVLHSEEHLGFWRSAMYFSKYLVAGVLKRFILMHQLLKNKFIRNYNNCVSHYFNK